MVPGVFNYLTRRNLRLLRAIALRIVFIVVNTIAE